MGNFRVEISDEQLKKAKAMIADGKSWTEIGNEFGFSRDTIRRRLDPVWREERAASIRSARSKRVGCNERGPQLQHRTRTQIRRDAERRLEEIPDDTRSLTGRLLGDPIPGRSALDKRHAG